MPIPPLGCGEDQSDTMKNESCSASGFASYRKVARDFFFLKNTNQISLPLKTLQRIPCCLKYTRFRHLSKTARPLAICISYPGSPPPPLPHGAPGKTCSRRSCLPVIPS